ncbi:MAG: hypothetical protein Q8P70_00940 [bacterium]|nr:hypothetical protein [bacterium]
MGILAFGTDSLDAPDLGIDQAVDFWTNRLQKHLQHVGCPDHTRKEEAVSVASFWLARHAQTSTQTEKIFRLISGTIHQSIDPEIMDVSGLTTLFYQLVRGGVPEQTLVVVTTSIRAVLAPEQGTGPDSGRGYGKRRR